MQQIELAAARQLVEAGAIRRAEVLGQPGGWAIVLHAGTAELVIRAQRGHVRLWPRLDLAAAALRDLGIVQFTVDARNHAPRGLAG